MCAKVFRPASEYDEPRDPAGFLNELEAQRRLSHPNILPILDYGQARDGAEPFVIYPLCRGGNLRALMKARPFVPFGEALPILGQVAAAIDAAHDHGFIHGDIKPENILFADEGSRKSGAFRSKGSELDQTPAFDPAELLEQLGVVLEP